MDIFTYELELALQSDDCALCFVADIDQRRWMETFVREGYRDAGVISQLAASRGFCPAHAELFRSTVEARGATPVLSAVCTPIVAQETQFVRDALEKRGMPGRRQRRSHSGKCPACLEAAASADRKIHFLCEALAESAFRQRYARSGGLCARHLRETTERAARHHPAALMFLLHDSERRLGLLEHDLSEYERKRDHRYINDPRGSEQDAPWRALRYLGGTAAIVVGGTNPTQQ